MTSPRRASRSCPTVLTGGARLAAMTSIMTAIGIGWRITWFTYAADYSRFVSRSMPRRKLYLASTMGQFLPVVWLGVLGASLATKSGAVDPGQLIVENYGALAIPVLLLVLHGPIATNILNIYTFAVAKALDVKIPHRTLSVLVGVLAMVVVIFSIFQENFAEVLDTWLVGLVAWVATRGGIMLVHYYRIERQAVRVDRLLDAPGTRRLPDLNWAAYVAFFAGVLCTWLFMYGLLPAFQGPIATELGGVDLSWLAGGVTAAAVYAVLGPIAAAKYTEDAIAAAVIADVGTSAQQGTSARQGMPPQPVAPTQPATPVADATGAPEAIA